MTKTEIAVLKAINKEVDENYLWGLQENEVPVSYYTGKEVDSIIDLHQHIFVWYKDELYSLEFTELLENAPIVLGMDEGWKIAIFPITVK